MKNIIVVTGASSGIGNQILKLLDEKEKVDEIWVIGRSEASLKELQKEVKTTLVPVVMNLSNLNETKVFKEKLEKEKPNIKVLVNSAGFGIFDHTENIEEEVLLDMVRLNCEAIVSMIQSSLKYMSEGSQIMNIASCAGFQPIPYINCYAATKAFVLSYSRALNYELKYRGIHVLAVAPFWTKTKFFDRAIDKDKKEVVINYAALYDPKDVATQAVKDLYTKKDVSCYGGKNKFQRLLVRTFPKKFVMKVWMDSQKLNGTPGIRD